MSRKLWIYFEGACNQEGVRSGAVNCGDQYGDIVVVAVIPAEIAPPTSSSAVPAAAGPELIDIDYQS